MLYLVHLWRTLETITMTQLLYEKQCPEIFLFPVLMVSSDIQNKSEKKSFL